MSNPMGDRNLLVGILAWQRKFIGADVLLAAMNAWTLAKEKGLAQILREQKALTENHHALLEEAVYDHLSRHGNDVQKSLAALNCGDPVKQELAQLADPDLQASLAQVGSVAAPVEPAVVVAELVADVVDVAEAPAKKSTPAKTAARKFVTPKPQGKAPARGRPLLVWLAGCALGGGFAAFMATLAIVLAVVLFPEIARFGQGKPVDDRVIRGRDIDQGGDKPAPIEEPVALENPLVEPELPINPMPPELPAKPPPLAVDTDFVPLFNGKDLTGWKKYSGQPGNWRVENGVLTSSGDGKRSGRLYTERVQPKDFHLRVEARVSAPGTGVVYFRCTDGSMLGYSAALQAGPGAVSVGDLRHVTLSMSVPVPRRAARVVPPGQWITLEIIAKEKRLIVKVDGEVTTDAEDAKTLTAGHILLMHSPQTKVEFRAIEIKELKVAAAPPLAGAREFVPLFNGKDLTGWKLPVGFLDAWRVEKGVLIGAAPPQRLIRLHTEAKFKDFHLRADMRCGDKSVATIGFRSSDGIIRGYNSGMTSMAAGGLRAGNLNCNHATKNFGVPRFGTDVQFSPGQWFNLEVIAQGNRFVVFVDGKKTSDAIDDTVADAGFVYLGLLGKETVEFRKLEISELNPAQGPAIAPADFMPLFNGKNLTGWKPHKEFPGEWRVEQGVLIGAAPDKTLARLHTERAQFKDFHLRLEARCSDKCLGTVGVRSPDGGVPGYNASLNSLQPGGIKLGGLIAQEKNGTTLPRLADALMPPGQWFKLEVIAEGNRLIVLVDGKKTTDTFDARYLAAGYISLGLFGPESIEFRKIEIRERPGP